MTEDRFVVLTVEELIKKLFRTNLSNSERYILNSILDVMNEAASAVDGLSVLNPMSEEEALKIIKDGIVVRTYGGRTY